MGGLMQKNDKRKQILKTDRKIREACDSLRHYVEHPNESSDIIMGQGIYKHKDPAAISTITIDGVEIGYQVKPSSLVEMNPYFDRYVYLKVPGYRLSDMTEKEMEAVKTAIYDAFFEVQQGPIHLKIAAPDCMILAQRFMVAFQYERSPGLVSIAGGMNA
jgi:hypothetical protein